MDDDVISLDEYLEELGADWDDEDDAPAPLRLAPAEAVALAAAVEASLRQRGCDNTLRAAQDWSVGAGLDWPPLRAGLEGRGGFCDCEVLLNVGLAAT